QMIGIPMLMCNEVWKGINFPLLGTIFIYIASFLALWSAFQYSYGLILKLKENRLERKRLKKQVREQKKNQKQHTVPDQENSDEKVTLPHHSDRTWSSRHYCITDGSCDESSRHHSRHGSVYFAWATRSEFSF